MSKICTARRHRLVRVGAAHRLTQGSNVGAPEAINPLGREFQG